MTRPYTVSAYTDADRADLLRLWNKALPLDAVTEGQFESRVLLDENFDPRTLLLARDGESIAGFVIGTYASRMPLGDADPEGTRSWITVLALDPQRDRRQLAGVLIGELEERLRPLGKKEVWVSTYPPGYFVPGIDQRNNGPLLEIFLQLGYAQQKEAISMDAPIVLFRVPESVVAKEEALAREGIMIRPYRRTDLVRFLDFLGRTMPSDWVRVERANLRKMTDGGFQPEQISLVLHGDDVIGYCQFEGSHFGPFGVADAYQGRGIGTVLLARTIERMKQQGHHDAWVLWTDDAAAGVYSKFGFNETRRFSILRKTL